MKKDENKLSNFEIISEIGRGSFSTVYKVKCKIDNYIYAMKEVDLPNLNHKEIDNSFNEVQILSKIKSEYIISYIDSFSQNGKLYLITEYAEFGDMEQIIKSRQKTKNYFNENHLIKIWKQIIKGILVLHKNHILHRDLKSANIFIIDEKIEKIKIGDLNVCRIINEQKLKHTQTGTPYYSSPEIWNNKPYDYKSDIWSLGCLFYEMTSFNLPFKGHSMKEIYDKIEECFIPQIPKHYSNNIKIIIKMCLRYNDKLRPSAEELIDYINSLEGNFNCVHNVKVKKLSNFRSFLGKDFEYPKNKYKNNEENKSNEKKIRNCKSANNIIKKKNNTSVIIECKNKIVNTNNNYNKESLNKSNIIIPKNNSNQNNYNNKLLNKKKFLFKDKKKAIKNILEREKEIKQIETEYNNLKKEEKKEEEKNIDYEKLFKDKMKDDFTTIRTYSQNNIRESRINNSDNIRKIFIGWSLAESYNYINQHSKGNLPQNSSIVPTDKNERPVTPNFVREKINNNSNQMNKALNYKIKDCKKIEERTLKLNRDKIRKININKFKVNSLKKVKSKIYDKQ